MATGVEIVNTDWSDGLKVLVAGETVGYIRRKRSWTGRTVRFEPLDRNMMSLYGGPYRTRRDAVSQVLAANRRLAAYKGRARR